MNDIELVKEILTVILRVFGPMFVRQQIDEWEAARGGADAAEIAKFGKTSRDP